MQNLQEVLIIAGNHKIDKDKIIHFDFPSKKYGEFLKLKIENSKLAYLFDSHTILILLSFYYIISKI